MRSRGIKLGPVLPCWPLQGNRSQKLLLGRNGQCLWWHLIFMPYSCMFEPEGNACSLTDSTAEEHVLALVEHAADEARDRINRFLPGGKVVSVALPWGPCHLASNTQVPPGRQGFRPEPDQLFDCLCLMSSEGSEITTLAGPPWTWDMAFPTTSKLGWGHCGWPYCLGEALFAKLLYKSSPLHSKYP